MFDEYVRTRTAEDWKFWIFSLLFRPLLTTFNNVVSTTSMDDLYRSTMLWVEQHCTLVDLRPSKPQFISLTTIYILHLYLQLFSILWDMYAPKLIFYQSLKSYPRKLARWSSQPIVIPRNNHTYTHTHTHKPRIWNKWTYKVGKAEHMRYNSENVSLLWEFIYLVKRLRETKSRLDSCHIFVAIYSILYT